MDDANYIFETNSRYPIEKEVEILTDADVNDTTKIIGNFMMIVVFIVMLLAGLFAGLIMILILMFFTGTILSCVNGVLTGSYSYSGNFGVLGNLFPLILFGCIIYGQYMNILLFKKLDILSHLRKTVLSLYDNLTNTIGITENIEQISQLIQDTFNQVQTIKKLLFFRFFFTKSGKAKLKRLGILATHIAMRALQDLRSDLSIRLIEQQSTLEQAKSELKKNITGNNELESISELQSARLNRQIEQFEELQRVLVKV